MTKQKYVVLSVNENPQYQFYLPLVCWAWKQFGWDVILFCGEANRTLTLAMSYAEALDMANVHRLVVDGYKSETVAQISRLYAASLYGHHEDYLMTSDIDMVPLSDYWQFDPEKITVWGHDLTGFQHIPICYVCMKRTRWVEVMGLTHHRYNDLIKRDLDSMPNAKSEDSVKRWVVDQDLLTDRINAVNFPKEFVPRGSGANGYPIGRVDRSAWSLEHTQLIDCHLMRDIYLNSDNLTKTLLLLYKVFPGEDFQWFIDYTNDFSNLVKNG